MTSSRHPPRDNSSVQFKVLVESNNVISDLTVLGDVIFQGDDNSLDDVDFEGDVFDSGNDL